MLPMKAPYDKITTEYGRRGKSWGCNKNASGLGVHTGADFAAPVGTPIYAPIDGQIRHRSYGPAFGNHQFAISPDVGQAFAEGEVFFAHTRTRLADGVYVKAGQKIAEVGVEGNTTGGHLHMEYHPNSKNKWNCSIHANPNPVLVHGAKPTVGGPYVTKAVYRSKCGYAEPTNGDKSSDTVKELQERLKRAGLTGGVNLVVTGKYDDNTDLMVRLWQEQVCKDKADQPKKSFLGPSQFKVMFPSGTYTLNDDGDAAVASPPPAGLSEMGKRFQRVNKYVTAQVKYEKDWDNDLIKGNGPWDPSFFLLHHTAISVDPDKGDSSLGWIVSGGPYAPVRLANWLVDRDGTLHVCAARKTYHAGKGSGYQIPDNTMNDVSVGVEIESMGKTKDLTDAQILTVSQLATGWFEEFKVTSDKALNHKDWSSTGKTDTLYAMAWWRAQFDTWNDPKPPEPPVIPPVDPPVKPDDGYFSDYTGKPAGTLLVPAAVWKAMDFKTKVPDREGLEFHMLYANCECEWKAGGDDDGIIRIKYVRDAHKGEPEDDTGYQDYSVPRGSAIGDPDGFLITATHWEVGEKDRGGRWHMRVGGGLAKVTVGTRYGKIGVIN